MSVTRRAAYAGLVLSLLAVAGGEAHKPVTSPYTFNDAVLPIVRERCARCHADGGAAPMSLLTYADARPWAESIRAELTAGHMPPFQAESDLAPFTNASAMPARDLDVLLTWATGGTPEGAPGRNPGAEARPAWPLGPPDQMLPLPETVTLPARVTELTKEFAIDADALGGRAIRAVDLKPGTPSIVRRAIIYIRPATAPPEANPRPDRQIVFWSPDRDMTAGPDSAFVVPPRSQLVARVTYRKTWKDENRDLSDRSTLGIYFAAAGTRPIDALPIGSALTLRDPVRAIAVVAQTDAPPQDIVATAVLPDNSRHTLIRLIAQREWPQRFWYAHPVDLPRGTRLESTVPLVLDVAAGVRR